MRDRLHISQRSWLGPTAVLLGRIYGSQSPVDIFTRKAALLCHEAQIPGPPFDPRAYASFLGIRVEERLGMTLDGLLRKDGDTFVIEVKRDAYPARKNFTIAHEIAHTFFYDLLEREASFRTSDNSDNDEEQFCDRAAAELLMPQSEFKRDLQMLVRSRDGLITPAMVLKLAKTYRVSLTAAATRLVWTTKKHACALWRHDGRAFNLQWIAPTRLGRLTVCQTGVSSIEVAASTPGKAVTTKDSFYDETGHRVQRVVASLRIAPNRILSVIEFSGRRDRRVSGKNTRYVIVPKRHTPMAKQLSLKF